jgi:hypothetical protein
MTSIPYRYLLTLLIIAATLLTLLTIPFFPSNESDEGIGGYFSGYRLDLSTVKQRIKPWWGQELAKPEVLKAIRDLKRMMEELHPAE